MQFPSTLETGIRTRDFLKKELDQQLIVHSIVLTEFMKLAGAVIGQEATKNRIHQLKERDLQIIP